MFCALLSEDMAALESVYSNFHSEIDERQEACLLRCLGHLSRQIQEMHSIDTPEVYRSQELLSRFVPEFRRLSRSENMETRPAVQRLFGFRLDATGSKAIILPTSFISRRPEGKLSIVTTRDKDNHVVQASDLGIWLTRFLERRLTSTLLHHRDLCLRSRPFGSPCYGYLEGRLADCQCHRMHVRKEEVAKFYNDQMRLCLRQLHLLSQGEPREGEERHYERR
jgi:hypothetical protein